MKWGWDSTCSMLLGCRILDVLPILCIAGFKRREKWISIYQIEHVYIYKYMYVWIYMCIYIYIYIYSIMKTICSPGYHHNGFVATHALRDMTCIHPSCFCDIWAPCCRGSLLTTYIDYKLDKYIYTHKHTHTYI